MKGARYKPVGWKNESHRHYLAAKGIKTKPNRYYYTPTYVAADMAPIAADGVGTAGAATVGLIPLVVAAGALYVGARGVKRKTEGKSFFANKHVVRIHGANGQQLTEELTDKQLDALDDEMRKGDGSFVKYEILSTFQDTPPAKSADELMKQKVAEKNTVGEREDDTSQTEEKTSAIKESARAKADEFISRMVKTPTAEEFGYKETLKETKRSSPEVLDMKISDMKETLKQKSISKQQKELGKGTLRALQENRAKRDKSFFAPKKLPVKVETPSPGTKYPVSPEEAKKVLLRGKPEDLKGLKGIEFSNPVGEQKGAWAQYVRSRNVIKIFSQPYKDGKLDGRPAKDVNRHMKSYVLPHEKGHHVALHIHKITDKNLYMAEARADAHVVGMSPADRDVRRLVSS